MRTMKAAAAALTVLLALTACSDAADVSEDPALPTAPEEEAAALPEPDLDGLPEVIVEVDGVEIGREAFVELYERQFEQVAMQVQMTGEEIDQQALREYTAQSMVDTQLLLDEAAERSIEPTEEEVSAVVEQFAASSGMSTDDFFAALEQEGVDRETALAEITDQTALEELYAEEAGELNPSEEELRSRYDAIAEQAGPDAGLPSFEEARPTLESELQREHENTAVQALVEELRADAEITYHW